MKVLLSIKSKYAEKIFNGTKKYEYRKRIFKDPAVDTIVVYVTKPLGKVVGEFHVDKVIKDTPLNIWKNTFKYSGIEKKSFEQYFKKVEFGFAIKIENVQLYKNKKSISDFNLQKAPQSFKYIE